MKKQIIRIALLLVLFFFGKNIVFAADVNLTIRNGANIIFSNPVPLQPAGTIQLQGHNLDADSVLSVLNDADIASADFAITDLQYYDSFGSFYLKCINSLCDNWQYTVNASYPSEGIDKKILSGGESVYVYFGPQNKIILSSGNINTDDPLTVTAQKYDYQNDAWITRTGVTVGLTQPDPNNPSSPTEIQTGAVDTNGQAVFSSIPAGTYNVGIKEDFYFPTENLNVTTSPPVSHGGGGGGYMPPEPVPKPIFDLKKAFSFLITQQKEDGSFGENLYTDWAVLAIASGDYQEQISKSAKYLGETKIENSLLTDYERHAMALMALGFSPYNANSVNYIEKITTQFDGKQFGDANEDNDDIFALIVLQNSGYVKSDKIINDDINFILSRQKENGSWDESIDMTGASIEALSGFNQNEQVKNALLKAKDFLKQSQKDNGSWNNNASSTAWAIEGILAMNEKLEDWVKNGNTPLDYLATTQDTDGGVKDENIKNKIWETAYVASSLSRKTWNQVMQKFEKPKTITIAKIPKKLAKNQKTQNNINLAKTASPKRNNAKLENSAAAINAISDSSSAAKKDAPQKGWFARLLENIFGFF